tara:strand:+ start:199 stop:771 length:573 start_codon:yes stop_codon:yes gene_type:complete
MINQNVNIVNFNPLYEILVEIKDNLSFQLINFETEENFLSNYKNDFNNSLIISHTNQKMLLNKNLFIFSVLPIQIDELIGLININLMKIRFNQQSKINIKGYELNLNSKFLTKDNVSIKLTEKEIKLILYLDNKKTKHSIIDLQKNIWGYLPGLETHTVETHIYRLRKKIKDKFNDINFILSHDHGYFIE